MSQPLTTARRIARLAITLPALRLTIGALAVGTLAAALWAPAVHAVDNTLVSTVPADGSTVETSPTSLLLSFASPLGRANTVEATCDGAVIALGTPQLTPDGTSLSVSVPTPMPKGTCVVAWRVSQADNAPGGQGSFDFNVVADTVVTTAPIVVTTVAASTGSTDTLPPAGTTTGSESGTGTDTESAIKGPLGLARLLSTIGVAALFGALVLIAVAWPEGVEYILTVRFLRTACAVAIIGSYFNVVALAAQLSGDGIGAALSPSAWSDLTDTTPGIAALARLLLSLACVWVIIRPERVIDPGMQLPALALPGLAVATLGFTRTGGELAALGAAVGVLHALAMAVWLGGLLLLSRVVLAGPGDDDLVHAVRGFARISTPAIVVTVVTGAVQTFRLDRGTLFETGHGWVLLLKAVTVGAMVFVGLAARQFINARLSRVDSMAAPLASRLRRALGFEALLGIVVLVLTSWLLALTPGTYAAADATTEGLGPALLINNPEIGAEVEVSFSQVVGANAVRVEVVQPVSGLSGLQVDFTPPIDSGVAAVILDVPLAGAGVAVLPLSQGLPLGAPGLWTVTVRIGSTPVGSKSVLVVDTDTG